MLPTCGQDELVLFHGQATEAGVSGARVLAQGQERRDTLVLHTVAFLRLDAGAEARGLTMRGTAPPGGQASQEPHLWLSLQAQASVL